MAAAKVALVTASSAGLGAATAKGLAKAGYRVAINYNSSKEKADAVVSEILQLQQATTAANNEKDKEITAKCIAIKADISKRQEIEQLVKKVINTFGRLDCVISNQGWTKIRQFNVLGDNVDETDWDTCFNMNVKSHLYLFHAAYPHLTLQHGSFVTVASLAGVIPSGSSIPYAVTKAAQIHLAKSLALVASPQVRVNSVSPGIILTDWGKKFSQTKLDTAIQKSALKRLAEIEDIVQQIVLLANTQSITAQNVVIDAGWSLG